MTDRRQEFQNDMRKLGVDFIALPVILFWCGLSLSPIGLLVSGSAATYGYWINALFLMSGFWGVLGAYLGAKFLMRPEARAAFKPPTRLVLTSYAGVWSMLYLAFFFLNR